MRAKIAAAAALLLGLLAFGASAQERTPYRLTGYTHAPRQGGHGFVFKIANDSAFEARLRGRLVVLNVYDTRQPKTLPIGDFPLPASGVERLEMLWPDPPLVGEVRALLVLNDGVHPSLVASFGFWIVPWKPIAAAFVAAALILIFVLGLPKLRRYYRERIPRNMIAYIVEYDDTVMSLSSRFDVSWQDVVKANRLKPPYELQPGSRIFLPKHALKRP